MTYHEIALPLLFGVLIGIGIVKSIEYIESILYRKFKKIEEKD